jgi:hypothetical protein
LTLFSIDGRAGFINVNEPRLAADNVLASVSFDGSSLVYCLDAFTDDSGTASVGRGAYGTPLGPPRELRAGRPAPRSRALRLRAAWAAALYPSLDPLMTGTVRPGRRTAPCRAA